jgi:cell division protein FtsI (penicillin-binding protein 3)
MRVGLDARSVRWIKLRVAILGVLLFGAFATVAGRAVQLQVLQKDKLGRLARDQYVREIEQKPRRGTITDRDGGPLAQNADADSIFVDADEWNEKGDPRILPRLAKALGLEQKPLQRRLERGGRFTWLKRQASPAEAEAVRALAMPGVGFAKESRRYYPQRELAGHLVGFVGADGNGLEGVERAFDDALQGESMRIPSLRDARGMQLFGEAPAPDRALEGARIELTLDRGLQFAAERALQRMVSQSHAVGGMAIALDPATGEILAVANEPTFNPNVPAKGDPAAFRNHALLDSFEPGSTFKVFSIAAALEEKAVKPSDAFFCENGAFAIGSHVVHDHKSYGWLGPQRIVTVSSNIGASKIAEKLGRERLQRYYQLFGFGEKTGTGLAGEPRGVVPYPRADIALATMSFGQGVTATALQTTAAMASIASGGMLMKPWIVKRVVDADGRTTSEATPTPVRRVVSREVAATMSRWMESVVQDADGTGRKARLEGFRVAGKTGTAQKADPVAGGYSADKRFSSFVGFLPAEAPRVVIGVFIDEPKGDVYGGDVAAPGFREIADYAMKAWGVAPSDPGAFAKARKEPPPPSSEPQIAVVPPAPETPAVADVEPPRSGGGVAVPALAGLPLRTAVRQLEAAGLRADVTGTGIVVAQAPKAGAQAGRGSRVQVTLAPAF